jgi:uncharacterized protein (TIGR03663 family)
MLKSDPMTPFSPYDKEISPAPQPDWLDRPLLSAIKLDREKALYGLFIALAALSRLWDLGTRVMSHDETVHVQWSWYLFQGRGYAHTPLSHGPFLFHATALNYYLFGDSDLAARLLPAVMGIMLVALPYLLRRWLGRSGALVTAFLLLISPSLLYYSRYIRHDIPIIVWTVIAVWAIFSYLRRREVANSNASPSYQQPLTFEGETRYLLILAAALSLMFATKEVAFIYIAILGLFLVILFFARLGAPRWPEAKWERWSKTLLWIALAALALSFLLLAVASLVDQPPAPVAPELTEVVEPPANGIARALSWGAGLAAGLVLLVLLGYVALLLASMSHRHLILTLGGVLGVILLTMGLLLFSLTLFELFPTRYQDCGQAPVPGAAPGEMNCPESNCQLIDNRCQRPLPIVANDTAIEYEESGARVAIRLTRIKILLQTVILAAIALLAGWGVYQVLDRWMPFRRGERPALDLILFIGSFALPFLGPFFITGLSGIISKALFGVDAAFNALDYSEAGMLRSAGFVFILLATSVAVGVWWDWRRWLPSALAFYVIFIVLFTTVFTNGNGLASGMVGSLGYWLEQQEVQRGSQPLYYYALLVPLYEYLPLLGFVAAALYVVKSWFQRAKLSIFVLFLLFWTLLTWVAYTIAGEKMPWLTTHFALPMTLASGWIVGKLIDSTNWRTLFRRGGWVLFLIAPVGLAALVQVISPWLTPPRPFSGNGLTQLNTTMQFLAALLVLATVGGVGYGLQRRISPGAIARALAALALGLLAILTIRTAWAFTYVNYDYANEFLVYAHSTPDVRDAMRQIEDISRRTSGDLSLDIGYTADGSYPFIWYLRNYPNAVQLPKPPSRADVEKSVIIAGDAEWSGIEPYLGDNYACNQYNFLWWPMQDYYNLNWERISYALTNPQMRAAMWDIIFRRDYRKYEQATGKTVRLSEWPLRDGFRFCIRRDITTRVWSETAAPLALVPYSGEPEPSAPSEIPSIVDYADLTRPLSADLVVSELGQSGNFNSPHGMAVDPEGFIYVADTNNHRIVKLSPTGQVVQTLDSTWWRDVTNWKPGCLNDANLPLASADGQFCEPWGLDVGPDGKLYVADTWNHRVQVFSPSGEFIGKFGTFGQISGSASSAPAQFYGPRDVALDQQGYIYVSDTGNKRVQVFDNDFNHAFSFGGPGIVEGRLDEPVGLTIAHPDRIYVADTWNQRIQAFNLQGEFVQQWPVAGWQGQSVVNKPFLATDTAGHLYASDPEGPRIIIFDTTGTPIAVLGGPGSTLFQSPTGLVLDAQDNLWVSDAANHRLLRFPSINLDAE